MHNANSPNATHQFKEFGLLAPHSPRPSVPPVVNRRFDVPEYMAYSILDAETAWPEVPETVKPSKKIREESLENWSKSHILKLSHVLNHSHFLKPSHAARLMPRAGRQVTYETPHLQGPVRSASPAEPEENTSKRFSNCLTPNGSYPVRAANSPTKLPARKALYAVSRPQHLRKIRASDSQTVSRRTAHTPVRVAMSPTKLPARKDLYAVHRPQNLRKIPASQRFSNRLTPDGSCPVRVARSPTKLPTCKVLYAVHRPQNLRKIRASRRFSNCLIFSNRLTRARPPSPPTPQIILR